MKPTTGKLAALALVLLLAALLAGCARMDVSLAINADGSADYGVDLLFDSSVGDRAQAVIAQATGELEAAGCTVTPLERDGFTGIRATRHYDNAAEVGATAAALGGMAGEGLSVKVEKGFFGTEYAVRANLDASGLLGSQEMDDLTRQMLEQVKLTLSVTLPVKAASHNAGEVSADGRTYTWELSPSEPNPIELAATAPNTQNMLIVGGGALLVLLIIVAAVIILAASTRRRKAAAAQRTRIRAR